MRSLISRFYEFSVSYFDYLHDVGESAELVHFLNDIGIEIDDFLIEKIDDNLKIQTVHTAANGKHYQLPLAAESDGTKKMISLFPYIQNIERFGSSFIIDELDADIHPLLLRYIVNRYHSQKYRAQLIFTAHDVTLLDRRYLRRDQIWFTSKDEGDNSTLHSLAEYKVRNDAAFDAAYLGGVFGAIPRFSSTSEANDGQR